jgi:uncharacterized integral membrane protein
MHIKKMLAFVLGGVGLLFIIQNMAMVEIRFLLWSFSLPRTVLLLGLLGIGFLGGWLWHEYKLYREEER